MSDLNSRIGQLGLGTLDKKDVVFRRKFRWTLTLNDDMTSTVFTKISTRPILVSGKTNDLFTKNYWLGSEREQYSLNTAVYDIEKNTSLIKYMTIAYDALSKIKDEKDVPEDAKIDLKLDLYDGCGCKLETWTLKGAYPVVINFGDLDYSSCETTTVEIEWHYASAKYELAETEINYLSHRSWIPGKSTWIDATKPFDFDQGGK